jgi:hypothetical protein
MNTNLYNLIEKKRQDRIQRLREDGIEENMPSLRISFFCAYDHWPILLPSVPIGKLQDTRLNIEQQLQQEQATINYRSYSRNKNDRTDAIADIIRAQIPVPGRKLVIGYAAVPDNCFLEQYMPRLVEMQVLEQTRYPAELAFFGLYQLINNYLQHAHKTSLEKFNQSCSSLISSQGDAKERFMATSSFEYLLRLVLGPLASMSLGEGTTAQEYFAQLEQFSIFPLDASKAHPAFQALKTRLITKGRYISHRRKLLQVQLFSLIQEKLLFLDH